MKMEVATVTGRDGVPIEHTCGLHGGGFHADTIVFTIQEQSDCHGKQKQICNSVCQDDIIDVMELHVFKAKLGRAAVSIGLGILTVTETEGEGNDE